MIFSKKIQNLYLKFSLKFVTPKPVVGGCHYSHFNFSRNLRFLKIPKKKMNFPTLQLGTLRILSGAANLATKCDFSNAFSFREVTCVKSFFLKNVLRICNFSWVVKKLKHLRCVTR